MKKEINDLAPNSGDDLRFKESYMAGKSRVYWCPIASLGGYFFDSKAFNNKASLSKTWIFGSK